MKKILCFILMLSVFLLVGCNENTGDSNIDLSDVSFNSITVIHDGESHSIYVMNKPESVKVEYIGNNVSALGEHTVVAKLYDEDGKLLKELTATITIILETDVHLPLV